MVTTFERAKAGVSTPADTCRFCEVAQRERLISSSEHTTVFPSLGAFIEGWVLVAPREHVVASSELPTDRWKDLANQLAVTTDAVQAHYGTTVTFEHGAAGTNRTAGCGVDHAHVHVVPWAGNVRAQIAAVPGLDTFLWHHVDDRPRARPGEDYIWISDHTGSWITYASELPSQVVRQAMSHVLGLDWWDWKVDHQPQTVRATLEALSTVA